MCNLYRLDPRDWSIKFVQDAQAFENLVNIIDSYEVYPIGKSSSSATLRPAVASSPMSVGGCHHRRRRSWMPPQSVPTSSVPKAWRLTSPNF
jgi:hypothetical protein